MNKKKQTVLLFFLFSFSVYCALTIGKSDAVLAASIFHYGKYTIKEVKDYLNSENVPIRLI